MRRTAAGGVLAALVLLSPAALATSECFTLYADTAVAPVEPGEPAALFTARGAQPLNELVIKLFDAQGSELPIAVEVDPNHESFFVRSAMRIEPGNYLVEYTHECSGTTLMELAFEASPPKPPDAPKPGDEPKSCDCRAAGGTTSPSALAGWLAFGAVVVALRRRVRRAGKNALHS